MFTFEIKKKQEHVTADWSGGKTTEVYIHPPHSSYAKRDFGFRLSSATVQLDRSEFTSLPGFQRRIMLLEGEMHLDHAGHHSVTLPRYGLDSFDGAWNTVSHGRCTDFNLMLGKGFTGGLDCIRHPGTIVCDSEFCFLYILMDHVAVHITGNEKDIFTGTVDNGDLLVLKNPGRTPGCHAALRPAGGNVPGQENALAVCAFVSAV